MTFGRDIAVFMNLKVPPLAALSPTVMMYPQTLVNMLREANGVEKEQAPLKDASGSLPGEVAPKVRGAASPQLAPAKNSACDFESGEASCRRGQDGIERDPLFLERFSPAFTFPVVADERYFGSLPCVAAHSLYRACQLRNFDEVPRFSFLVIRAASTFGIRRSCRLLSCDGSRVLK